MVRRVQLPRHRVHVARFDGLAEPAKPQRAAAPVQRSQPRLAAVRGLPVRPDERDRGVPQRDAPAARGRHERRQRGGRRVLWAESGGRDVNSEPVQDPSPRARGPRRTIAGQVPFDINPAARGA